MSLMKLKLNSLDYKEAKGALKVERGHIGDLQQFNVKLRGIIDDVLSKKESSFHFRILL